MRGFARPAVVRACAAIAAAALATSACGGGERQDAGSDGGGPYVVDLEQARFAPSQRIAERSTLVITVRNSGDTTIPNLAVTVHGFDRLEPNSPDADPRVSLWTIDEPPPGTSTAVRDTWTAGALAPGRRATLRWHVTPIVAGTHTLDYSVAPTLEGSARAQLRGGAEPRGRVTVMVDAKPAFARVDPVSGRVIRER